MSQDETQTMDDFEIEVLDDETVLVDLDDTDDAPATTATKAIEDTAKKGDVRIALKQAREREKRERERADRLTEMLMGKLAGESTKEPTIDPVMAALKSGDYDQNLVSVLEQLNQKVSAISGADTTMKLEVQLLESKWPGISEHADEVVRVAKQKGLTPEQAYLATYGKELLTRSKDDVLREYELKSATKQTTAPRVSAEGNGNQQTTPNKPQIQLKKSELEMLEKAGISPADYAKYLGAKAKNGARTQDELSNLFGNKKGSKKG